MRERCDDLFAKDSKAAVGRFCDVIRLFFELKLGILKTEKKVNIAVIVIDFF